MLPSHWNPSPLTPRGADRGQQQHITPAALQGPGSHIMLTDLFRIDFSRLEQTSGKKRKEKIAAVPADWAEPPQSPVNALGLAGLKSVGRSRNFN